MPAPACTPSPALTGILLDSYLGQGITAICPHGYDDSALNHCAHFACHVMSVAAGSVSCRGMSRSAVAGRLGVCIRVHELFAACPEVGRYDDITPDQDGRGVFVFVTAERTVDVGAKRMTNVPKKHVGIGLNGTIWHYSNTQDKVVTATPQDFRRHYRGQTNGLYFGTFPGGAVPASFGCGR